MTDSNPQSDPMAEITAMKAVADALAKLDNAAKARVLQWAAGSMGVAASTKAIAGSQEEAGGSATYQSLADLYAATSPATDVDRALVAGYWFQFVEGAESFASQTLNAALKDLGHGVGNITRALDALKAQTPALVMQLRKSGTSKQARKMYKLTAAGKKAVELLVSHS